MTNEQHVRALCAEVAMRIGSLEGDTLRVIVETAVKDNAAVTADEIIDIVREATDDEAE